MDKAALVSFISFVELDHEITRLTQKKELLIRESAHIEEELNKLVLQKKQLDEQLHSLKKNIDNANLELKALDASRKEKKEKLEQANSSREYQSLEQEIGALRKQQEDIEEIILNLWSEYEQAQVVAQAVAHQADTTKQLLGASQEKNKIELEQLENRINNGLADVKKQALTISPDLLITYNTMKERIANPAVPVIKNSCTGCFYAINPGDMQQLKSNNLVTCKDCYRLLYLSPQADLI
jgi:predicted  nucleic acid-binding Zn-ribbon protein